eukprot:Plantae.Rhodophyta-Purpureofilum_apyrenoidigerum.ctg24038.p1 GENE.Plantae.Rhodophyta-Purpureofilum_apyrenoidigerum.ctg24038~~Plantae.Rhodophyta-Purpureofilum_apyrenoidigerum.ctg24038.p1  ORF type:complete len:404 (-),score=61.51 Plantae.Rhodophyta-Purpureofilum_apyrenoidigerum.ctg24038:79-1290(-)
MGCSRSRGGAGLSTVTLGRMTAGRQVRWAVACAVVLYASLVHVHGQGSCTLEMSSTLTYDFCTKLGEVDVFFSFIGTDKVDVGFSKELPGGGWVGLSVASNGGGMVDSYAVVAGTTESGASFIESYKLVGYRMPEMNSEQQIETKEVFYNGDTGVLSGRFVRPRKVDGMPELSEGAQVDAFATYSNTVPTSSEKFGEHKEIPETVKITLSASQIDNATGSNESSNYKKVFISHGVMMAAAWILIVPMGAVAARKLSKRTSVWFQAHRFVQLSAILIAVAAWILALVEGAHDEKAHLIIGCITMSLAILLAIVSLFFRPNMKSSRRIGFNLGHRILAVIILGLAIANCYIGINILDESKVVWYTVVSVVLGVMVVLALGVLLMHRTFHHGMEIDSINHSKLESD